MRIIHLARHNKGGADNEGAIAWALTQMGHTVTRVNECDAPHVPSLAADHDLVLVQKLSAQHTASMLRALASVGIPSVFWYCDKVRFPHGVNRIQWVRRATQLVDLGFCTDGDWVAADHTGKLVWLMQGADERFAGPGKPVAEADKDIDVLFTGIAYGERKMFEIILRHRYGSRFKMVQDAHKRDLADLIARSKVVVAPRYPATDRYWSNRVYVTLSMGACLVHPYCEGLDDQYAYHEVYTYANDEQMIRTIDWLLENPEKRASMAELSYNRTIAEHTYRHRCKTMMGIIQERLF